SPSTNWWTGEPLEEISPGVHLLQLPNRAPDIYNMPTQLVPRDAGMHTPSWPEEAVNTMTAAVRQTAAAYGCTSPLALVNDPRWEPVVSRLGWPIVYDCLDHQAGFAQMWQTELGDREQRLFEHARLLVFSGRVLSEEHGRAGSVLLPNGCDYELFSAAKSRGLLAHLPRPICGFFGAFSGWLDLELIEEAARLFPSRSFVYIGSQAFADNRSERRWRRISLLPNVAVLDRLDPAPLADHLAEFDVCTMPFLDTAITRAANAVKIYEYLAAGKPVISRDLAEIHPLADQGLISVYRTKAGFFECLDRAIQSPGTPEEVARRRAFAAANTWDHRVDELSVRLRRSAVRLDAS
ncbi:MAG: glycosyltransferase, partial [Acidobacteriia bacterium]|nr:glycosyltransferase [Terriglobia bacterium]